MTEIANAALARLKKDEVAIGVGVRLARSVEIAKMMRASGYDWLFLDLEHGSHSLETTSQIAIAALDVGVAPIVRVPAAQWDMGSRALDGGALGIMLPHVETAEDARAAVRHLRFPPVGHRGTLGGLPLYDYRPVAAADVAREVNAATLIVTLIESPAGVANAEAIAATPGIDVLFVGINDLSVEMGLGGDIEHPKVAEAVAVVAAAARRQGKWSGIGGISSEELLLHYIGIGMRLILGGNDFSFMMAAARHRADVLRGNQSA
jgi:2-keto-3-deoxy-L-rhamnonate aldolase RhmA